MEGCLEGFHGHFGAIALSFTEVCVLLCIADDALHVSRSLRVVHAQSVAHREHHTTDRTE
jgi:hypothetical protein